MYRVKGDTTDLLFVWSIQISTKRKTIPIFVLSFDLEIMALCFVSHSTHL